MKILLIDHYAGSADLGMEFRPYYLSKEWVKLGHEVLIVGGSFSHLRTTQPKPGIQIIDGINYFWVRTNIYKGNGLGRVLSMILFVLKLYFKCKKLIINYRPEVIISSSTYPIDIFPAHRMAIKAKSKLIFEVHDLWPLSLIELGGHSKYNPLILIFQAAENYAYKYCDEVVSILPLAKEHMVNHGLKPDKFNHIPNGITLDVWENPKQLPEVHQNLINKLRISGKFLIGFTGTHGIANSLSSIINACTMLHGQNVVLILVGSGVEKKRLSLLVEKSNISNIYFLDPINKHAVPTFLKQMDALFIGLKNEPLFRFGISPNKIFDYMMAAKPIIQAINAGNNIINEANCGLSVESENSVAIADAILKLKSMSEYERNKLGQNGQKYVNQFHSYNVLALDFLQVIRK
jgi:glycosyltransferase involved in cell wall biosynthesis